MITVLRCCCSCAPKFSLRHTPPDLARSVRFRGGHLQPLCRRLRSPHRRVAALIPQAGLCFVSRIMRRFMLGFLQASGRGTGFTGPGSYAPGTIDLLIQVATAGDLAGGRQVAAFFRFPTSRYPLDEASYCSRTAGASPQARTLPPSSHSTFSQRVRICVRL